MHERGHPCVNQGPEQHGKRLAITMQLVHPVKNVMRARSRAKGAIIGR